MAVGSYFVGVVCIPSRGGQKKITKTFLLWVDISSSESVGVNICSSPKFRQHCLMVNTHAFIGSWW